MSDDNANRMTAGTPDAPQTPQTATSGPNLAHPDYWAKPGEWTPQFEGQRPPYAPGNMAAVRSGAHSPRLIEPRARELAAGIVESRPDLAAWPEAVAIWATYVAQFERESARAKPDRYWLVRLGNAALKAGQALGLDPTSYARLQRDQAATVAIASHVDLDALAARGRAALDARAAGDATTPKVATAIPVDDNTTRKDDR